MPSFRTEDLLQSLTLDVKAMLQAVANIKQASDEELNKQPAAGKWSIAQVLEHLNSYNRYYLPEIEKALSKANERHASYNPLFKSGWFGNYFTNMMLPKQGGKIANKMQAPKDHRPADHLNSQKVIEEFVSGQTALLRYLQLGSKTDIGRVKVPISISRFIKLKLGDTFRFLIAHQQRHFVQISNVMQSINSRSSQDFAHR